MEVIIIMDTTDIGKIFCISAKNVFVQYYYQHFKKYILTLILYDFSGYNNGHHHNGYYKTHSSTGYPIRQPGYPMAPPQEPYPDYEELGKGDGACAVPRKALLALYCLVASIATAMMIGLVVLAPARKALEDAGILEKA